MNGWLERVGSRRELLVVLAVLAVLQLAAGQAAGSVVKVFRASSAESFLEGTLEAVSLDARGSLILAQRVERLTGIEEPFVFSAARFGDGWVVGTGNDGKVLKVDAQGTVSELFRTEEPEVYALHTARDGTVFAGSSPEGKVYRFRGGQSEVLFEPGQKYIWAITQDSAGRLLVGTGTEGLLYRGDPSGEAGSSGFVIVYDSKDSHLRALQALADGVVAVGTAGEGLILRVAADGKARTLYDAAQPEVTSLALGDHGTLYASVLASEASLVDLTTASSSASTSGSSKSSGGSDSGSSASATVSVKVDAGSIAAGSRPAGFSGARSAIVRIAPSGASETIWSFEKETVFALAFDHRLWAGTGMDGKLYSFLADQMVLEKDVDELQIIGLVAAKQTGGPAFVTTNAGAFYRTVEGREPRGTYTSEALDAGALSRFGTLHWQGDEPAGTEVRFQVRTGMSADPDATWTDWTTPAASKAVVDSASAVRGRDVSLAASEAGRYVQWRAVLERDTGAGASPGVGSPRIVAVDLSYVQGNQKPEITSFEVLEPGKIVVPSNFNPSNQAYEPAHPNRDGIFTVIGKPARDGSTRTKELWKQGYRTLQWKAKDANDDKIEYNLSFARIAAGAESWLPIADQLEASHLSFDSTVLPDGMYRFRLVASDHKSNLPADAKTSEKLSEVVAIDHSPPQLLDVAKRAGVLEARVADTWSPLREAVYSIDAGEWRAVAADDGLIDGRSEGLRLEVPQEASLVLLRLTDAAFNVTTFDLSQYLTAAPPAPPAPRRGARR